MCTIDHIVQGREPPGLIPNIPGEHFLEKTTRALGGEEEGTQATQIRAM